MNPPSIVTPGFSGLALAGHASDVLVGIGARSGGPVDVVVVASDESQVRPADVRVAWRDRALLGSSATSCGSRCLRFPLHVLAGARSKLVVVVTRPGKAPVRVPVQLPAQMPASAAALLHKARANMLRLHELAMDETLGAGLSKPVVSRWWFQAPDRLRYSIVGGAKAVVVGTWRWDYFGRRWRRSSSPVLRVPTFPWEQARQARPLGGADFGGTRVRLLAAWLPGADVPTWFVLYVTREGRVLRTRMLTTGHFMTDTYHDFGSVPPIRPPR